MSERALYGTVIGVLVALLIVMLVAWDYDKDTDEALVKAAELIQVYEAAGLPTPQKVETVARVLGTDAAAVCEPIANDADLGMLKTRLGVGGEFYVRATDVDEKVLFGLAAIVSIYCPDELPTIEDFVDDFDLRSDLLDLS